MSPHWSCAFEFAAVEAEPVDRVEMSRGQIVKVGLEAGRSDSLRAVLLRLDTVSVQRGELLMPMRTPSDVVLLMDLQSIGAMDSSLIGLSVNHHRGSSRMRSGRWRTIRRVISGMDYDSHPQVNSIPTHCSDAMRLGLDVEGGYCD